MSAELLAVRAARRRPRIRHARALTVLVALLIGAFFLRVLGGDYTITFPDFVRILDGAQLPGATYILMESKLPRAVLGVLVGVAFGVSGAIYQRTLRNPLASPDIVGVSVGASAAAVFGIVVLHASGVALSVAAVVGAIGTAAAVRLVTGRDGGYRLVLVGVTAAAGLTAVIQYLFTRADEYDAQLALQWLTGSLSGADWPTVQVLALCLLVLLPLVASRARAQEALELGSDTALSLGVPRHGVDGILLLATVLTALAVAAAGPVAFVAFVAGPVARALNGGRTTLLGAALVGAVVMVGSDYVAAYALPDTRLPAGVVTGALGAPFLLWLLTRSRTSRRSS